MRDGKMSKVRSEVLKIEGKKKYVLYLISLLTVCLSFFTIVSAEEIKSRAAVVMDSSTGRVLYAKNPELRLMPASTTKLMTALIVVNKADLKDVVTISRNAARVAPTRSGFKEGDRVTIETLLYAALMKSANDASVALAEAVAGSESQFVELMNSEAIAIGANDTHFVNPNGLPGTGQHTTAYDLAKIMRQAIKHPVLKGILGTRVTELSTETGRAFMVQNTNRLLWIDEELLGGKTGFTQQARHCFVCAGERDKDVLIVALLGAPSRHMLWKETEELMAFGYKVMSNQEEPVVYLTRADYDSTGMTSAAYTKKKGSRSKYKKNKAGEQSEQKVTAQKKSAKKKYVLKNSRNKKVISKANKTKKTDDPEKGADESKG